MAVALGVGCGSTYDLLDRANLPGTPLQADQVGVRVLVAIAAIVMLALAAAVVGGEVRHRSHKGINRRHYHPQPARAGGEPA